MSKYSIQQQRAMYYEEQEKEIKFRKRLIKKYGWEEEFEIFKEYYQNENRALRIFLKKKGIDVKPLRNTLYRAKIKELEQKKEEE